MQLDNVIYLIRHIFKLPTFVAQFVSFRKNVKSFACEWKDLLPILHEKTQLMTFDAHYIYHTGWAARVLRELSPVEHVDISSSLMFCAIASANTSIRHYDFRTPVVSLSNLQCGVQDVTKLSFETASVESISCMHVIEHVGLGRYGDPLNDQGDTQAAKELIRVVKEGGHLMIVLPMGQRQCIRFNAHRIYSYQGVMALFGELTLVEFAFLNDKRNNTFIRFAKETDTRDSEYGCGCFLFKKPDAKGT